MVQLQHVTIAGVVGHVRQDADVLAVRFAFEMVCDTGASETWSTGPGWTRMGASHRQPGFDGLALAADTALTDVEADVVRRGATPLRAFDQVEWLACDAFARDALRTLGLLVAP